jgi:hypothetical protein
MDEEEPTVAKEKHVGKWAKWLGPGLGRHRGQIKIESAGGGRIEGDRANEKEYESDGEMESK